MARRSFYVTAALVLIAGRRGVPRNAHAGIDVDIERFPEMLVERVDSLP